MHKECTLQKDQKTYFSKTEYCHRFINTFKFTRVILSRIEDKNVDNEQNL